MSNTIWNSPRAICVFEAFVFAVFWVNYLVWFNIHDLSSVLYSVKIVKVKRKITEDFILDLYEKSKKLEGKKKKKLLKTIELLSTHVGEYLVE